MIILKLVIFFLGMFLFKVNKIWDYGEVDVSIFSCEVFIEVSVV